MIRTQIQLTEVLAMQVKQIAAKEHISISELIRRAVAAFIDSSSTISDDKYERAAAITGQFSSGKNDMAINHDDYFIEATGL